MWIVAITINTMIFLNFLIAVISDVYADVQQNKVEESYQKKAEILRDLDVVFGKYVQSMPANILVSRRPLTNTERNEISKDTVRNLKQSIAQKHIEISNKVKNITGVVEVIQKTSERHEEELNNIRHILSENHCL